MTTGSARPPELSILESNEWILLSSISTRVGYSASLGLICAVASRIVNEKTSGCYRALSTYGDSAFKIDVVSSRVSRVDPSTSLWLRAARASV